MGHSVLVHAAFVIRITDDAFVVHALFMDSVIDSAGHGGMVTFVLDVAVVAGTDAAKIIGTKIVGSISTSQV